MCSGTRSACTRDTLRSLHPPDTRHGCRSSSRPRTCSRRWGRSTVRTARRATERRTPHPQRQRLRHLHRRASLRRNRRNSRRRLACRQSSKAWTASTPVLPEAAGQFASQPGSRSPSAPTGQASRQVRWAAQPGSCEHVWILAPAAGLHAGSTTAAAPRRSCRVRVRAAVGGRRRAASAIAATCCRQDCRHAGDEDCQSASCFPSRWRECIARPVATTGYRGAGGRPPWRASFDGSQARRISLSSPVLRQQPVPHDAVRTRRRPRPEMHGMRRARSNRLAT